MKRILFDVREIEKGKYSGIGRFVTYILKNKNYFDGFKFIVVGNSKTDFNRDGLFECEKYVISDKIPIISEQYELYRLVKKIRPDIYFSPYYKYPILIDVAVITSIFDLTYLVVEPYKNMIKNKFYKKSFIKYFTARSRFIITSSYNTMKDILRFFRIDESKIRVTYLPIDERFKPQGKDKISHVLNKYGISKKYVLYVGNDNFHKNIISLYRAYVSLPASLRDEYDLIFVGFKDIKGKYPDARVIERVDDEELLSLYSGSSLFVFPSLYEGFGYPPLEALSCGARVLSSNTSSLREILGENVVYFDPLNIEDIREKIILALTGKISFKSHYDLSRFELSNFLSSLMDLFRQI